MSKFVRISKESRSRHAGKVATLVRKRWNICVLKTLNGERIEIAETMIKEITEAEALGHLDISVHCESILDIEPVMNVCAKAPARTEGFVMMKLMEEVGEFAKAVNQPERCDERPSGEAADVINCVLDELWLNFRNDPQFDEVNDTDLRCIVIDTLNKQLQKKTSKWANQVGV